MLTKSQLSGDDNNDDYDHLLLLLLLVLFLRLTCIILCYAMSGHCISYQVMPLCRGMTSIYTALHIVVSCYAMLCHVMLCYELHAKLHNGSAIVALPVEQPSYH